MAGKRGARIPRALRLNAAVAAIADEVLNLWWAGPYSPAKHAVVTEMIRKHLGRVVKLEGGRS